MDTPLRRCELSLPQAGQGKRPEPVALSGETLPVRRMIPPQALARLGPPLALLVLAGPVLLGLLFTILPAFGYLPAIGGTELTLEPFRRLFEEPGILRSAGLSLWTGLLASFLSLTLVAFFFAGFSDTRAFDTFRRLLSPLLALPHAAAAFGLAFLIAPSGMVARLLSPELTGWTAPPDLLIVNDRWGLSLVMGLALKEIPFLALVALAALPQTGASSRGRVAASLGYGRMAGFIFGVWPSLYRQMRLAVFAVVAFSTSVVDMAAILGPGTPPTLALRLVRWSGDPDLSLRFLASAGALLQLGVSALAILAWIGGERFVSAAARAMAAAGWRFRQDRLMRGGALVAMLLAVLALLAGAATLTLWSFAGLWAFPDALPQSFEFRGWKSSLARLSVPLWNAGWVGILAAVLALLIALLCLVNEDARPARRNATPSFLLFLPLLVPQAAFLFGLQLMFLQAGITASRGALVLAHLVFVLPYVLLSLSDPWRAFDRRFEHVAAALGRRPWVILFRIRLPMLLPALLAAAAIGFAVSVGLYLPTLLIGAGRISTITTEAVALASGNNRRVIGTYALAQMLLPVLGFAVATLLPALLWRARLLRGG